MENDGLGIVIEDSKHGFMKGYRNGVLYYVDVFRKEVLFSEVKSYFNLGFWLELGKKVAQNGGSSKRTIEKCQQIGQLLKEKRYDQIAKDKK